MKKLLYLVLVFNMVLALVAGVFNFTKNAEKAKAYDWSTNNLASDGGFVNVNALDMAGIQAILNSTGGGLAGYTDPNDGRSAAEIIYDAAHGREHTLAPYDSWLNETYNGVLLNESTGTVSPIAILATLQKEQSLVYAKGVDYNQHALDWATGYGVCDSCSKDDPKVLIYKGFAKQVEWGAWGLRYGYERAAGYGASNYQVGQTQIIDDVAVTFSNRATASLYRYTPHLGTNFSKYFEQWGGNIGAPAFQASWVSQSDYPTVANGATQEMTISYRNTGSQTWARGVVNLGLVNPNFTYRTSSYDMASGWPSYDRPAILNEATVLYGGIGTFTFNIKNNGVAAGNHRLDVGLVADGIAWFNEGTHAYWDVAVPGTIPTVVPPGTPAYRSSWVSQSDYPTVANGATQEMTISYRNTGSQTWTKGVVNLGLVNTNFTYRTNSYDMASDWISFDRPAILNEATVPYGETGTFTFNVKNNSVAAGNHRLDVGLVADGIAWFNEGTHAYWDVWTL